MFLCPNCGGKAEFATRCADCDVPLVDESSLAPWGLEGLATDITLPPVGRTATVVGALIGALLGLLDAHFFAFSLIAAAALYVPALVLGTMVYLRWRAENYTIVGPRGLLMAGIALPAVLDSGVRIAAHVGGALLGGVAGIILARAVARGVSQATAVDPEFARFDGARATAITNAVAGRVRVRGRVHVVQTTYRSDGVACAAYERSMRAGSSQSIRSRGGVFELHDDEGAVAHVRGERVRVLGGGDSDGVASIRDGDTIEVVGEGQWDVDSSDEAQTFRSGTRRVLDITGTDERPVLLRVASIASARASAPSTAVRADISTSAPAEALASDAEIKTPAGQQERT